MEGDRTQRVIIHQVVSSVVDHWSNCSFRSQVLILYTKLTGAEGVGRLVIYLYTDYIFHTESVLLSGYSSVKLNQSRLSMVNYGEA